MDRPFSRLLMLSLALTALGGCSAPASLALLVDSSSGSAPESIQVRAYSRNGLLASQKITKPALPGAIKVTSLPSDDDELRIIVLGLGASGAIESLAATKVPTPITSRTQLPLELDASFSDGDGDGVPDKLDDCPTVADENQANATGFDAPGDACAGATPGSDLAGVAGSDMMPVAPACPANALCDSFDEAIDANSWRIDCEKTSAGCAVVDSKNPYRGSGSLHIRLDAVPAQELHWATVTETRYFPAGDVYARAYVWVPSGVGPDATAVFTAVQGETPYNAVTLQIESNGFSMYNGIKDKTKYVAAAGSFPRDQWFCLEWELKVGTQGAGKVWVEGVERRDPLLTGDTTSTPPLAQFSFGATVQAMANEVPARDLWFDEVVVSATRVGCQ